MWRLACPPMDWLGSAYCFCKLIQVFTNYLRRPSPPTSSPHPSVGRPTKRFLRNARWRGTRFLPYMDDFLFLALALHTARHHMPVPTCRNPPSGPTRSATPVHGHTTLPSHHIHHLGPLVYLYAYHLPSHVGLTPLGYNCHWPTQRLPRTVYVHHLRQRPPPLLCFPR
jgi:hypothetical protein